MLRFTDWGDPVGRWWVLRQFRRADGATVTDSSGEVKDKIALAASLLVRDSPEAARKVCLEVIERFPSVAYESADLLKVMLGTGLLDQAQAVMAHGHRKHPREYLFLYGLAEVADRRKDHELTPQLCEKLRRQHATAFEGYGLISCKTARRSR